MKGPPALPMPQELSKITRDASKKTRREWENTANDYVRQAQKFFRKRGREETLDLTPSMAKRKVNAALDAMPEALRRYAGLPGWNTEENPNTLGKAWLHLNLLPCTTYNSQESGGYMMYAAAIWMLDQIMTIRGNHWEILRWLPRDDHVIDEITHFPCAWDCNHEDDLILSVVWVIMHRNDDTAPLEEDVFGDPRVWTSNTAAQFKKKSGPFRANFEGLLSMIPEESIQEAVDQYRKLIWAWADRYFAGLGHLEARILDVETESNEIVEIHNRERKELRRLVEETSDRVMRERLAERKNKPVQVKSVLNQPAMSESMRAVDQMVRQMSGGQFVSDTFGRKNLDVWEDKYNGDSDITIISRKAERMDQLRGQYGDYLDQLDHLSRLNAEYIDGMTRNGHIDSRTAREVYGDDVAQEMTDLPAFDPYQICFAMLYLLEQGDDLPWLCGMGTGLIHEAVERLPWGIYEYDAEYDTAWETLFPEEEEEPEQLSFLDQVPQDPQEEKPKRVLADPYERKYHAKKEDDPEPWRSLAQIVYEETGCILPRNMTRYDDRLKPLKRKYGLSAGEGTSLLYMANIPGNARRMNKALNFDEAMLRMWDEEHLEEADNAAPEEEIAEAEISPEEQSQIILQLRQEVQSLKKSLHESERKMREAQKNQESEREVAAREHRELADLREYVFSKENQEELSSEENITEEEKALFPCELKNDTVIFGGHETWLKAIRPMLKGRVRFIDKDFLFDTGLIRHADIIWIQPNAISHKQYYRIIDVARGYKKPVRYFSNASAAIGARQVARYDAAMNQK